MRRVDLVLKPKTVVTVLLSAKLIEGENWVQVRFNPNLNEAEIQSGINRSVISEQIHKAAIDLAAMFTGVPSEQLQIMQHNNLYFSVGIEPKDSNISLKIAE